jgi:hypothetical protein
MKKKYKEAESAYQTVKHDLESTTEDLCRVKEALKQYVLRLRTLAGVVSQICFVVHVLFI